MGKALPENEDETEHERACILAPVARTVNR